MQEIAAARVDLDLCRERGVVVSNVPDYATDAAAELALAFRCSLTGWSRTEKERATPETAWPDAARGGRLDQVSLPAGEPAVRGEKIVI